MKASGIKISTFVVRIIYVKLYWEIVQNGLLTVIPGYCYDVKSSGVSLSWSLHERYKLLGWDRAALKPESTLSPSAHSNLETQLLWRLKNIDCAILLALYTPALMNLSLHIIKYQLKVLFYLFIGAPLIVLHVGCTWLLLLYSVRNQRSSC